MPISHLLLVLLVVFIWGINFIFVKLGLEEISPLLLGAVRFFLCSLPAIFIKPPNLPFQIVILYGLIMFALQFAFFFSGMHAGMTPGMGSLIMQVQIFFSMFFAAIFLNEKPGIWQISGALIAFLGISVVAFHFDHTLSLMGFLLILCAAASWGFGNLITKKHHTKNVIGLIVWGSLVAFFPLALGAWLLEGPIRIEHLIYDISWLGIASICYIAFASTLIGYGVWNWLLNRYPIGMLVPFTLLVPIIGIFSSAVILNEPMQSWKIVAALLVISGLIINLLNARLSRARMAAAL